MSITAGKVGAGILAGATSELLNALACAARAAAFDDRRANRALHGKFFSAHLLQGTRLSHPVFAFAQF